MLKGVETTTFLSTRRLQTCPGQDKRSSVKQAAKEAASEVTWVLKHEQQAEDGGHSRGGTRVPEVWRERIGVGEETGEEGVLAHQYIEDRRVWRGGDFWALPVERLAVQRSGNAGTDSELRVVSYKP